MPPKKLPHLSLHRDRAVSLISLGIEGADCLYIDEAEYKVTSKEDFKFVNSLGFGQFCVEAWQHIGSKTTLAVKIVPIPSTSYSTHSKDRLVLNLQREIAALKVLRKSPSDFIVTFHGFATFDGCCHLFMEIMNMSLADLQQIIGKFPEDLIGLINVAVLNGLCHLHELGLIHRDVKPDNVLMNWTGEIKLADFGLTRDQIQSRPHTIVGTICYQPPELLEKRNYNNEYLEYNYDDRVDSWALGLTLLELASGEHPYTRDIKNNWNIFGLAEYMEKLDTKHLINRILKKNSTKFKLFVEFCLQKNFAERAHCSSLKTNEFYGLYRDLYKKELMEAYFQIYKTLPLGSILATRRNSILKNKKRRRITAALKSYFHPRDFKQKFEENVKIDESVVQEALEKSSQQVEILAKLLCRSRISSNTLIEEEIGGRIEVTRFEDCEYGWSCKGEPDSINFQVNVPLLFCGICLYGPCDKDQKEVVYKVKIEIHEHETCKRIEQDLGAITVQSNEKAYQIHFPISFSINPNVEYTITTRIQGPTSYKGIHGLSEIEKKLSNGKSIKVRFSNNYGRLNTSVLWGQIPTLIFEL